MLLVLQAYNYRLPATGVAPGDDIMAGLLVIGIVLAMVGGLIYIVAEDAKAKRNNKDSEQ